MPSPAFERFAGLAAIAAAVVGLAFSVTFVVVEAAETESDFLEGLQETLLLLGGVLSTAVLVALYGRLRDVDPAFALWALVLGVAGGIGSAVHGAYDLANVINPPVPLDMPNPTDPRGFSTFGLTAVAVGTLSWLIVRSGALPRRLGQLGFAAAALLVIVYLARLIEFESDSPVVLIPAVLLGFLVNPAWYLWIGLIFRRTPLIKSR